MHALLKPPPGIEHALDAVIAVPQWRTGDLGGPLGTRAFAAQVARTLQA